MTNEKKKLIWRQRAASRGAVVPRYFEVSVRNVNIVCGRCGFPFSRNLIPNVNEPTFVCPAQQCRCRNWIPVTYKRGTYNRAGEG